MKIRDITDPARADENLADYINVLLQEVGHNWLVPNDLKFRLDDGTEIQMLSGRDLISRIYDDVGWSDAALIGRDQVHWSSYFKGGGSPFDGVGWTRGANLFGATRWDNAPLPVIPVTQSEDFEQVAPHTINIGQTYCDLDLVILNAIPSQSAYPGDGNLVFWNEPILTSNIPYHAGIVVTLTTSNSIYFGFFRDHRKLAIHHIGEPEPSIVADLGDTRDWHEATKLRVVQRGSQLLFQAALITATLSDPADENPLTASGPLTLEASRFKTISTLTLSQGGVVLTSIVGVGVGLRTIAPLYVEMDVLSLDLNDSLGSRSFPINVRPDEWNHGVAWTLPIVSDRFLRRDVPGSDGNGNGVPGNNGEVWLRDGRLQIVSRFALNPAIGPAIPVAACDDTANIEAAPKALIRVSGDNFSFAAGVRLRRSIFSSWASGGAAGTSLFGTERSVPASRSIVPDRIVQKWTGDKDLRFAFIICAENRSDISDADLQSVDTGRRFWNGAFGQATRGRWRSRSAVPGTWPDAALDLFAIDGDGHVVTTSWRHNGGWSGWSVIGPSNFPPSSPLAAVARRPTQLDLFAVGNDGFIKTNWWNNSNGWGDWYPVVGTSFQATFGLGQPTSVVARGEEHLDIFIIGLDGQVWTIWWDQNGQWGNWYPIRGLIVSQGKAVAVAARNDDHLDLFVIGDDGRVYSTSWDRDGNRWADWFPVKGTSYWPTFGSQQPIRVVARSEDNLDLFVVGLDGKVWTIWWTSREGWGSWYPIEGSPIAQGKPVSVVARNDHHLDLFVIDDNGQVQTTWWDRDRSRWSDWFSASGANDPARFIIQGNVAAASRTENNLDLFTMGLDGEVWTNWWNSANNWGNWYPVSGRILSSVSQISVTSRCRD
jgi:hypothetical protein